MTKTCPHAASGCDYPASECSGACTGAQHIPGRLTQSLNIIRDAAGLGAIADTPEIARRLVACWNACDGIRTEALEHRAHLLKAHDDQLAIVTAQRDKLQSQLDAANKACNKLAAHVDDLLKQRDHWYASLLAEVGKRNKSTN